MREQIQSMAQNIYVRTWIFSPPPRSTYDTYLRLEGGVKNQPCTYVLTIEHSLYISPECYCRLKIEPYANCYLAWKIGMYQRSEVDYTLPFRLRLQIYF